MLPVGSDLVGFTTCIHFFHFIQQETEKLLEKLPEWNLSNVKFNESKACLPGTRQQLLDGIRKWCTLPVKVVFSGSSEELGWESRVWLISSCLRT
jgi:hypothetical protein